MKREKDSGRRLEPDAYRELHRAVLKRDGWRCQVCGGRRGLEVHHIHFRSRAGPDDEQNLITLCTRCHRQVHGRHELLPGGH
jgi:5-methylcytosine-specific restriction endonuclease McrA